MRSKGIPNIDLEGVKDFAINNKWFIIGSAALLGGVYLYSMRSVAPPASDTASGGFSMSTSAPMSGGVQMTSTGVSAGSIGSATIPDNPNAGLMAPTSSTVSGIDPSVAAAFNLNSMQMEYGYSYNMAALKAYTDISLATVNLNAYTAGLSAVSGIYSSAIAGNSMLGQAYYNYQSVLSNNATSTISSFMNSGESAIVGNVYGPNGQNIGSVALSAAINSSKNGANNGLQGLVSSGVFSSFLGQTTAAGGSSTESFSGYSPSAVDIGKLPSLPAWNYGTQSIQTQTGGNSYVAPSQTVSNPQNTSPSTQTIASNQTIASTITGQNSESNISAGGGSRYWKFDNQDLAQ